MEESELEAFDAVLRTRTIRFLDGLTACVDRLQSLIEQYEGAGTVDHIVDEIRSLESECDGYARALGMRIANADVTDLGIRLTRVHLHAGRTIDLFQQLDEVANTVEQFAEELEAIGPDPVPRVIAILREMAVIAADAMAALRTAVISYIDVLCETDTEGSITAAVTEIRALESEVDRLRNDTITAAFDIEGRDALVYREFALYIDALVDTMEDVTDHMIHSTGNRPWIDLEPAIDMDRDDSQPLNRPHDPS